MPSDIHCVTRYEEARWVLSQPELFSSRAMESVFSRRRDADFKMRHVIEVIRLLWRLRMNPFRLRGAGSVITLDPPVEEQVRTSVQRTDSGSYLAMDPATLDQLVRGIEESVQRTRPRPGANDPVLLISQAVRAPLAQLLSRVAPRLSVLSHNEVPPDTTIIADGRVELADAH